MAFQPKETNSDAVIDKVERCVTEVKTWMIQNRLKLNDDKTELIVFSTKRHSHLSSSIGVKIGDITITPSSVVRDLGVFLDDHVSMKCHVQNLRKAV